MILIRTPIQVVLLVVGFLAFLAQTSVISKFILQRIRHPRRVFVFHPLSSLFTFTYMLTYFQIVMSLMFTPIVDTATCVVVSDSISLVLELSALT